MIEVAYDISILGQGYGNPKARTGIYRMVESLLFTLIKNPEISFNTISLNADSSYWDYLSVEAYLEFVNEIIPSLSIYSNHIIISKLYKRLIEFYRFVLQRNSKSSPPVYKIMQAIKLLGENLDRAIVSKDLVCLNSTVYHSTYFPLPNLPNSTKKILTIYDLIPQLFPDFVTKKVFDRGLKILDSIDKNQDWIICISEHTKQDFCNYLGMNPEQVFVTPLAASDNFYSVNNLQIISQIQKRYGISKSPYLLSLCTLEPRKNLSFLLRCFAQILAQEPTLDINLVLVGISGWKNNDIFQTVETNPILKSHVIFTGFIPDQDLSAIYSGALAFVYPSLYEGFGLPPLEAMQCGTPVITSNTSSLPEVVGDAGIMVNPTDTDALCQAMLNLINNSQLRKQLSNQGIARAKQFSWSKCASETVKVYEISSNK